MDTSKNWFFRRIAALRGARCLAYLFDMPRCCAPCALRFILHNRIFRGVFDNPLMVTVI